jgi:hypothetical protein
MTDYYVNFAPAEAVKYDGTNARQIAMWMFPVPPNPHAPEVNVRNMVEPHIRLGQWLIRQGDRVWVQDKEPAKVERWLVGNCDFDGSMSWHGHNCECYGPLDRPREVCAVLNNGWSGPWQVVDGE